MLHPNYHYYSLMLMNNQFKALLPNVFLQPSSHTVCQSSEYEMILTVRIQQRQAAIQRTFRSNIKMRQSYETMRDATTTTTSSLIQLHKSGRYGSPSGSTKNISTKFVCSGVIGCKCDFVGSPASSKASDLI